MPRFKPISRRTFLTGTAGVSIALPFLEAMLPRSARAGADAAPLRFVTWTQPNGTVIDNWACAQGPGGPTDFELSPNLAPLADHKDNMVILQHIEVRGSYGHHLVSSLTGRAAVDEGYPNLYGTGISLDQRLAQAWAGQTPIPSLELAVVGGDSAHNSNCISWAGEQQPMVAESNPFAVFSRLFPKGVGEDDAALERLIAARASILDNAKEESQSLMNRLGRSDQRVLENYFDSLRDVEQELADLQDAVEACGTPTFPEAPGPEDPWWLENDRAPEVLELQSDLVAIAFQCDLTRVVTLTVAGSGGAYRTFPFIEGVAGGHDWHGWSHDVETGNTETLSLIDQWHSQRLAGFLDRLAMATDSDGSSVLYNSLVFANNEYGPNGPVSYLPEQLNLSHYARLMPYVLYGQAGGVLETGRNIVYPLQAGMEAHGLGTVHSTRLLLSILHLLGVHDEAFGDPESGQGVLPELV